MLGRVAGLRRALRLRRPLCTVEAADSLWDTNAHLKDLLANNRHDEAFDLYLEMEDTGERGCKPSAHTFRVLTAGLADARRPDLVQVLHHDIRLSGLTPSPPLIASLLDVYGRFQNVPKVEETILWMESVDVRPTIPLFAKLTFAKFMCGHADSAFQVLENYRHSELPIRLFYHTLFAGFEPHATPPSRQDVTMMVKRMELLQALGHRLESSDSLFSEEVEVFVDYCVFAPSRSSSYNYKSLLQVVQSPKLHDLLTPRAKHHALKLLATTALAVKEHEGVDAAEGLVLELLHSAEADDEDGKPFRLPHHRLLRVLPFFVYFDRLDTAMAVASEMLDRNVKLLSASPLVNMYKLVGAEEEAAAADRAASTAVTHVADFEGQRATIRRFADAMLPAKQLDLFKESTSGAF